MVADTIPKTKVALVGAGYVCPYHIRALRTLPWIEIVGVADVDPSRAAEMASRFGIPRAAASLEELAAAEPHVVHVLTPPATHASLAVQALEMGCHVLVEKPMAESVEDCRRMIACAAERRRCLSVNHSMRFDPAVAKALELVRRGVCGELLTVDFFRSSDYPPMPPGAPPPHYRDGGFPFRDLGVHGLYLMEAFLGEIETVETWYHATGRDPLLYFDEWRALVRCRRGLGQVQLSWNARPMLNELLIQGSEATLRADCYMQTVTVRRRRPVPKTIGLAWAAASSAAQSLRGVAANVVRFATGRLIPSPSIHFAVIAFHRALREQQPPPVSPEEGRRVVDWVERAARQADEDKRRAFAVRIPARRPRILVTGGTGFLGRALVRRLRERGEAVRLLTRRPMSVEDAELHCVYGDLGDPSAVEEAVQGVQVVYHVAAAMRGSPTDFERGTVAGTSHVIEFCLKHKIEKLVYVSSLSVLDHARHCPGNPVDESWPLEPHPQRRGWYTQTKLEAERRVQTAARERGLPAVILRPGQIFGPGAEKTPPSGVIALGNRWIIPGSGRWRLPLVYIDDVADALILAAETETPPGSVFHVVDPETVTQREYVEKVRRSLPAPPRVVYVPYAGLWLAAAGIELLGTVLKRSVPLTRYRLASLRPLDVCDCSAARRELGWVPRVGVRRGLELTFPER